MKTPTGFVTASTSAKKITICAIPNKVIIGPPRLETFRTKQRVHQINEKKDRSNSGNCVFHLPPSLSKAFGRLGKPPHQDKENNQDSYVEEIQHDSPHN